jgi:hypothetical protein
MKLSIAVKTALTAGALTLPLLAFAESNVQTGAGVTTGATAHVDFSIVIPKVLFLRVGTGSTYPGSLTGTTPALSSVTTVDEIIFTLTPAQAMTPLATVAGTGGDLNGGVETAALVSNSGSVTLGASTVGALNDGGTTPDTIAWTQITTAATANTSTTVLQPPVLVNGTGTTLAVTPPTGSKIIQQDAKWTYSYANGATVPAGGTYGGINTQNSRVTYTASAP